MKNEETIYDSKVNNEESTQLDNQTQENQETQEAQDQSQDVVEEAPETGKKSTWRKVATSMGAGILLGGVSSFLTSYTVLTPESPTPGPTPTPTPGPNDQNVIIGLEDGDVDMATTVNDDMSFSEAFAAARAEVGGGGAFVWNGNVYSTYTAEEWDAMTDAQKEEYYEHLSWNKQEVNEQSGVEVVSTTPDNPVDNPIIDGEVVVNEEPEVEVLGVVHDEGTNANFGVMNIDGQEVIYVDMDNDHVFDVAVSDMNHDGEYTADEMADVSSQQLTVEMFEDAAMNDDIYLASDDSEPDYINDVLA